MKRKKLIAITAVMLTTFLRTGCVGTVTEEDAADWFDVPDECSMVMDSLPGLPFTFHLPEPVNSANVSSVDDGVFYLTDDGGSETLGAEAVGDNAHRICWSTDRKGVSYVEIRFLKSGKICGYAVTVVEADYVYSATVLKCVKFTNGAGKLTTLGASEVENRIGKAKDEHAGQ